MHSLAKKVQKNELQIPLISFRDGNFQLAAIEETDIGWPSLNGLSTSPWCVAVICNIELIYHVYCAQGDSNSTKSKRN